MNSKLTDELLEQLATLSKLELTDTNKTELRNDLEQLLTYVDKISELSTESSLPMTHFPESVCHPYADNTGLTGLREDTPGLQTAPEQLVSLAPKQSDSFYIVPNTLHTNR